MAGRHRTPFAGVMYGSVPSIIAWAAIIGLAFVLVGCSSSDPASTTTEPDVPPIESAQDACSGVGEVADGGTTIILDTKGEAEHEGDSYEDLACVLVELGMPSSVVAQMDNTRALDGMQAAEWDGFEASWTYHPDDGMSLVLTEAE